METARSLPPLQVPATCPYPEPEQSSTSSRPISFRFILILSSHLRLGLPSTNYTDFEFVSLRKIEVFKLHLLTPTTLHTDKFSNPEIPILQNHLTITS